MDIVDETTRSRMMSGIKSKNTRPEIVLRRALHNKGFRYKLHGRGIPGRPDLVLPKHRALVFVHGCFWHRHQDCKYATVPSSRRDYWRQKFKANVARDAANQDALLRQGWRVAVVWECALRKPGLVVQAARLLADWLTSKAAEIEIGVNDLSPLPMNGDSSAATHA